jgi:hypothetical protein
MGTMTAPANADDAFEMLRSLLASLVGPDPAGLPPAVLADRLQVLEQADAVGAAARSQLLEAFDAQDGSVSDGQRNVRTWLVNVTRVTRGQAHEHKAVQALARGHQHLLAALAEGTVITRSVALQLARWTQAIPAELRDMAEQVLVAAARAGADLRTLATICAEIRARTAQPDPDDPADADPDLDRALSLDTTLDGAGVLRGDLTPQCAAMVQAVLDALSIPTGAGDLRTHPQRYHDALQEAMKRLLASDLLPQRAGQPVKALVHISFADLLALDPDSTLQDKWATEYQARWAAHRAAASVTTGDGGAWLEGDAARKIAYDAMIIPVVTGDIDPGAVEDLIALCVEYDRLRAHVHDPADAPGDTDTGESVDAAGRTDTPDCAGTRDATAGVPAGLTGSVAGRAQAAQAAVTNALADLEHQILAKILQVLSGPGGAASFLRRHLLGKPLGGPSLPLDVGQTDDIPVHLRRLVALRDQTCQFPGGCDQPAASCEAHHVIHRKDGGHTSLTNLKDYCWWHHHVVLHQLGWTLTAHPDGTSTVRSLDGKIIHSHSPPPRPG